jgi:NMT1/THI5 like
MLFIVAAISAQVGLAQETKRLRFAVTTPPHFLPVWLAKDTGLFSKQGLDVEVIFMRGGALITMGVISGELQLSGIGAESVVAARAEGGRCYASGVSAGFGSRVFDHPPRNQDGRTAKRQSHRRDTAGVDNPLLCPLSLQTFGNGR